MLFFDGLDLMAAAIRRHDPELTDEQAGDIALSIGDTPQVEGEPPVIIAQLDGREYRVPFDVVFPDEDDGEGDDEDEDEEA